LPDREACSLILKDCLTGLGQTYRAIAQLGASPRFAALAAETVGLDGRAIRKMVANALASTPETAVDPTKVTIDQLIAAAKSAKANRNPGGKGQ
jgi:hypothetical protein